MEVYLFAISVSLLQCFVLIRAQNVKREKQGVSFAKFVKASSVKLDEPQNQLASLKVSRPGECTFECVNNHECYSVNFASGPLDQNAKYSCELLKTDKFTPSWRLVESQQFDHYYIKVCYFLRHTVKLWETLFRTLHLSHFQKGFSGSLFLSENQSPARALRPLWINVMKFSILLSDTMYETPLPKWRNMLGYIPSKWISMYVSSRIWWEALRNQ